MLVTIETSRIILQLLVVIFCINKINTISEEHKHRVKRKVIFTKNSKLFFRLNGKDNVIPWNQVFAHGWTIRVNYDLPENIQKRHKFFKRNIHEELENIQDSQTLDGVSCIFKYLCEATLKIKMAKNCGFFCEIGNIITRHESGEADFFKTFLDKCDFYMEKCPHSIELLNDL